MIDVNDPKLTAYVLGELDEAERAAIEADLDTSSELRQAVDQIRHIVKLVTQVLQAEPCPSLTDKQREAIRQSARHEEPMPKRGSNSRYGVIAGIVVIAATLLVMANLPLISPTLFAPRNVGVLVNDDPAETESRNGVVLSIEDDEDLELLRSELKYDVSGGMEAIVEQEFAEPIASEHEISDSLAVDLPVTSADTSELSVESPRQSVSSSSQLNETLDSVRLTNGPAIPAGTSETSQSSTRPANRNNGSARNAGEVSRRTSPEFEDRNSLLERESLGLESSRLIAGKDTSAPRQGLDTDSPETNPGDGPADKKSGGFGKESEKEEERQKESTTWKRSRATPNASRLMIGDRDELPLEGMQVNVMVDGFRARVLLDLYFFNDRGQQLEGTFKVRMPNEASLYYFAFGQTTFQYEPMVDQLASTGFLTPELVRASGTGPKEIFKARSATWANVKEARVVQKEKAAHAYSETVRRRVDPALVEWSGAGVFNAHVFPLMPKKLHRIVIGYDVNLTQDGDDLVYNLDLPEELAECSIDIDVSALPGSSADVKPGTRPFVSGGRAFYHYKDPKQQQIEVRVKNPGTVMLTGSDGHTGDFFATRLTPNLDDAESQAGADHAVFLVDTSLSSNPDKFNIWLHMLESVLDKNRDTLKHFAVQFFNIESHWWKNGYTENTPENVRDLMQYCSTLALEGATDVRAALTEATSPAWQGDRVVKNPDLFLLSDGAATWGELDVNQITRALQSGTGGTLFAYKTGLTGTAIGVLEHLARESGGSVFAVVGEQEVAAAATAHRSRPWQIEDVTVSGGSDLLLAGRPRSIYPGQSLLLVGRGTPGEEAVLSLRRGDEETVIALRLDRQVESDLTARLYGQVAVGQLEDLREATREISIAYARHFRVPGQTCSLLMLESDADYARFNIKPEDDIFVVKSSETAALIERRLIDEMDAKLLDPKAALQAWLKNLERVPGVQFKISTAMKLALDQIPSEAFDVKIPRLTCKEHTQDMQPKKFFETLVGKSLDYDAVAAEARRRLEKYGSPDALRALSNLLERNPGDMALTRDVAFSAIEWGFGGQAYPLLRRLADSRPFEPQVYQAIGQCLSDLERADLAMVYYEIALSGKWHNRYQEVNKIVAMEYVHLLRRIKSGELQTSVPAFANARLDTLSEQHDAGRKDLVITMMWSTDRTDVDLHVREPSGEECFYKNRNTRSGGAITRDVTEGYGPEMYVISKAKPGKYTVLANYYGTDANRTQARTKVYVTVYEFYGTKQERVTKKTVLLNRGKEKRELTTVNVDQ